MFKYLLLVSLSLLLISCSQTQPSVIKSNQKTFEKEDAYILFALRAEQIKDYPSASELFEYLYKNSNRSEYLYRSLENDLLSKHPKKLLTRVDKLLLEIPQDINLIRIKIVALFELNRLDEASKLAIKLSARTQEARDYLLTSDVLIKRQEFDLAVRYLEGAYTKEYNEKILDKMSIILYVNLNRKKEAIAHLETHMRMHSCSKMICARLAAFYSNDNNLEGLLSTYLRLFELDKDEEIAKKIIQIYSYKQDYLSLMSFLEKSKSDDEVLLQLYASSKNYKKASPLSYELYERTSEIDYLGQNAIYEYEQAEDKNSKELLNSVVRKLEKVTKEDKRPLYMNYLGYILIDHEIDIKKGMTYIDEVLLIQPNSSFYLDSKAWGYYKLGECSKAKSIMDRVVKLEGGDDPEVLSHIKSINKCLKNKKGKK
ncbi:hypothetical protein GJV85_09210 [Sulfurimonas aquatica]|uniref:ATP-dependent nuclease subunit B n=1 Tax=Sulfurimonas aquatica TaxID=2672570 RepID=A0A975GD19_9BACT|nr:hypothetical protein [Sulfurimonas aquatica]QSZ42276.1 hypothetical protein GJV85_09210 [Sulfurimonas aquatica]